MAMESQKLQELGKGLLSHPEWLEYARIALSLLGKGENGGGDPSFLEAFLHADEETDRTEAGETHSNTDSLLPVLAQVPDSEIRTIAAHRQDHREFLLALKPYLGQQRQKSLDLLLKLTPFLELLSKEGGEHHVSYHTSTS